MIGSNSKSSLIDARLGHKSPLCLYLDVERSRRQATDRSPNHSRKNVATPIPTEPPVNRLYGSNKNCLGAPHVATGPTASTTLKSGNPLVVEVLRETARGYAGEPILTFGWSPNLTCIVGAVINPRSHEQNGCIPSLLSSNHLPS